MKDGGGGSVYKNRKLEAEGMAGSHSVGEGRAVEMSEETGKLRGMGRARRYGSSSGKAVRCSEQTLAAV